MPPRRRLALRPPCAGLQGEPLRRARGDRARTARQARRAHAAIRDAQVALYDEGLAGLDGIDAARRASARDAPRAATSTSCASTPSAPAPTRDDYSAARPPRASAPSIHFLPVHRLTCYRERLPRSPRCRSPSTPAARCSRCRSRPRTPEDESARRGRRAAARAARMRRSVRVAATLILTGLAVAYLVWKIDLRTDSRLLREADRLVRPLGGDHGAPRCRWRSAGSGCSRRGACTTACLADARVLRLVHGEPDPADLDRRRRRADHGVSRRHPGRIGDN